MDYFVGGIAGIFEVAVTHPIDLLKNRSQVHNTVKFSPYAGIKPKLISVVPIRMVFWGSTYGLKDRYSPVIVGSIAGFSQTLIETPAEVLKMRQSLKTNQPLWAGFGWHAVRNMGFAACVVASIPYSAAPIGALVGCIITHPLDTLKTASQTGLPSKPVWSGLGFRSLQSMIAMSVGQGTFFVYGYIENLIKISY